MTKLDVVSLVRAIAAAKPVIPPNADGTYTLYPGPRQLEYWRKLSIERGKRSRVSRRRWKARALMGQPIPMQAIRAHRLEQWREWDLDDATFYATVRAVSPEKIAS